MNENIERHKRKMRENLASEKGQELRSRRSNEVESCFGDRKFNQRKGRFVLVTKEKVEIESGLYWTTHNIRKIYQFMLKNWLSHLNVGDLAQICELN
jgi:thymidylate synthase